MVGVNVEVSVLGAMAHSLCTCHLAVKLNSCAVQKQLFILIYLCASWSTVRLLIGLDTDLSVLGIHTEHNTSFAAQKELLILRVTFGATWSTVPRLIVSDADLSVLGVHTERKASMLALQGDYTGSRAVALMNQRLGWRSRWAQLTTLLDFNWPF